jgi:hypothetical protein
LTFTFKFEPAVRASAKDRKPYREDSLPLDFGKLSRGAAGRINSALRSGIVAFHKIVPRFY